MKRFFFSLLVAFCGLAMTQAQTPTRLTSVRSINQLDNTRAATAIPAEFEATLTYFRPYEQTMFVQDGDQAMFVLATTDAPLVPGDRIRIQGTTKAGLRPFVETANITLLGHGVLPAPHPTTFKELINAAEDCMRVTVQGQVRSAVEQVKTDVRGGNRPKHTDVRMQVLMNGGMIDVLVDLTDGRSLDQYIDAEVSVTGIAGGEFDGKLEQTGAVVHVPSMDDVRIVRPAATDPWSLPATPLNQVMRAYDVHDRTERIRVHGTITFYQPGTAIVLQDGSRSLLVSTLSRMRLGIGEQVDAIGFPDAHSGFLMLNHAVIKQRNTQAPVTPEAVTWSDLADSRKVFDLVAIEGTVVTQNRETGQDEYVINSHGHLITAIFRHNVLYRFPDEPLPGMKVLAIGSTVRITGVCIPEDSNPFGRDVPFSILLRSGADLVTTASPPWLSVHHLAILVGWLAFALFVIGLREWLIERKVRRENAVMAYIEKRRSKILEDINDARPLTEILERITQLGSARLNGAACWCRIQDGALLGNAPAAGVSGLRVVEKTIRGQSGGQLGTVYAAFAARTKPTTAEQETLDSAAGLATLAIETSRLYLDLVHRSEFDLLTDIENRFSLERFVDSQIDKAHRTAGIFGILYIDLDRFKLVNDLHGHHVGDIYLQQVAQRMKRQLRPGDMLARLGGDEFAAVVPAPRSLVHLEEIAARLERCFEQPFECGGLALRGSASIGLAMYPADGTSRDALLRAADTAMYARKNGNAERLVGLPAGRRQG